MFLVRTCAETPGFYTYQPGRDKKIEFSIHVSTIVTSQPVTNRHQLDGQFWVLHVTQKRATMRYM
jgi:hypothetical protein